MFDIVNKSIIVNRVVIEAFLNLLDNVEGESFFRIFLKNFPFVYEICSSVKEGIVKGKT